MVAGETADFPPSTVVGESARLEIVGVAEVGENCPVFLPAGEYAHGRAAQEHVCSWMRENSARQRRSG
jgi:hypothetical protein